jgi:hypothetical protein
VIKALRVNEEFTVLMVQKETGVLLVNLVLLARKGKLDQLLKEIRVNKVIRRQESKVWLGPLVSVAYLGQLSMPLVER